MLRRRALQAAISGVKAALGAVRAEAALPGTAAPATARITFIPQTRHQVRSQWNTRRPDRVTVIPPPGWGPRGDPYVRFQSPGGGGSSGGRGGPDLSRRRIRTIVFLTAGGGYVWWSSREEIPYTGRMHAILVDPATELQLGAQTYQEVLMQAKMRRTLLSPHHPASVAVARVGRRIAAVASDAAGGGYSNHMKGLKWEFSVINSPECNAFVVPGGKVVVYTGLLRLLRTEDELAAVIAHEAGHVVARHVAERLTQGSVLELIRVFAFWVLGIPIPSGLLTGVFFLPNSRKAETEADIIGIQLAARACYDPTAAIEVFTKLGEEERKAGGDAIPSILRTHPVSSERVKRIKVMLPKAEELREASGCATGGWGGFERAVGSRVRGVVRTVVDWGA